MEPYLHIAPPILEFLSPASIMSAHNVNLRVVLSDARRIIKANRGHFLALSLLFVIPLSLSTMVYPSLSKPTPISSSYNRFLSPSTPVPEEETPSVDKSCVFLSVIYFLFKLLLSFFTTAASITQSIVNEFFDDPLKFIISSLSLKSIMVSLFPLTVMYIVSRLILWLIFFAVACLAGLMYGGIFLLASNETDFRYVYFLGFVDFLVVLLVGVRIHYQLEWYLADVIAVVESKRSYAPLRRSSDLVKGMIRVAFSIFLYLLLFGIVSFFCEICCGSVGWMLVLQTVALTGLGTILRLYRVAATAVLFIYCKALLGKSFELDPLYVRFLYDGDKKARKEVV